MLKTKRARYGRLREGAIRSRMATPYARRDASRKGHLRSQRVIALSCRRMRRFQSAPARISALVTALLTVWCLGCSAYDPILAGSLGAGMRCASEGEMASMQSGRASAASSHAGAATDAPSVSAAPEAATLGVDCGCGSCTATTPSGVAAAIDAPPMPMMPASPQASRSIVAPEPLIPPPQIAL